MSSDVSGMVEMFVALSDTMTEARASCEPVFFEVGSSSRTLPTGSFVFFFILTCLLITF